MEGTTLQQSTQQTKFPRRDDLLNVFRDDKFSRDIPIRENSDSIPLAWRVMPPQFSSQQFFPKNDHFDFEDMQEVARFRKPGELQIVNNYEKETEMVIRALPEEARQQITNNLSKKSRLQSLVAAYLKDIRDDMETRQRMMSPHNAGGMGFESELANRILEIIKKEKGKHNPAPALPLVRGGSNPPPPYEGGGRGRSPAPTKIQSIDTAKIQALKDEGENQLLGKPKIPQPPAVEPPTSSTINFSIPVTSSAKSFSGNQRIGARAQNRIRMSDIAARPPAQLTKPSLEFRALDIDDLRREASPDAFIAKIAAHIQTLSESDYSNRAEAISAWKSSPLYAKYLNIGAKSLADGKEVREYISQNEGAELSYQEFEAIGKLNQRLRF